MHERVYHEIPRTASHVHYERPVHERERRNVGRQFARNLRQGPNLLHRPQRAEHSALHPLLLVQALPRLYHQVFVGCVQLRTAGEYGVGRGAVCEDAAAYVDEIASRGQMPVHVYVRSVNGGHAEVVGNGGRIVSR